jgi:iron complex outermembrane receptor protein
MKKTHLAAMLAGLLSCFAHEASAQVASTPSQPKELGEVRVDATVGGYATGASYHTKKASLGPLGTQSILDTAASVTVVPEALIVNEQGKTVNDMLRNLPSVEIRDQQGLEVSRPQSRGFQGTIVQNTRLDGLNVIGTTAIPAENLSSIQVLNGMAGSLYGPATPAGVFNYLLKRPTAEPLVRLIESYDSRSVLTEQADVGGFTDNGKLGYRFNLVHGEGTGYVKDSNTNRTLFSGAIDYHFDDRTVLETNFSHYETDVTGLPGSVVYDSGKSTVLPPAEDPTRRGYGQPGAGTDLETSTGLVKFKHDFGNGWDFEVGGLYQDAIRHLYGITNTFTDNLGNYKTTKNFTAVPRFTIFSNTAQVNGHFDFAGTQNDVAIGTNGFTNDQYQYRNSIAVPLGSANVSSPVTYPTVATPPNGGQYKAGIVKEQSFIVGDTMHVNDQWAVQGVVSDSYIRTTSYNAKGAMTSNGTQNGAISPTVSVLYKPMDDVTTYVTWSKSVEQGEAAPAGTVNANQFLAPYHDRQLEAGVKYAWSDNVMVSFAAFRMTRPLADTDAATNVFAVVGTQKNTGVEFFVQGDLTHDLSVLGGVTYINARLLNTGTPVPNGKLVVGVPHVKSDLSLDYHPAFAQGFALTGTAHAESERAATNTNNSYGPGYATFDVGVRYTASFQNHAATVRLQEINVTNKFYYSSIADGNIVGSPGANTAYYGAPRTLQASVEVDL